MHTLTTQINLLREIAFLRPNAHIAFLFFAPYRKLYDTKGGIYELTCKWGYWTSRTRSNYAFKNSEYNYTMDRFSKKYIFSSHPLLPSTITVDDDESYMTFSYHYFKEDQFPNKKMECVFIPFYITIKKREKRGNKWIIERFDHLSMKEQYKVYKKWAHLYSLVKEMCDKKMHVPFADIQEYT